MYYFVADPKVYSDQSDHPGHPDGKALSQGHQISFAFSFLEWRRDLQSAFAEAVRIASQFVSNLAFSDWDRSLCQMSVSFLRYGRENEYREEKDYWAYAGCLRPTLQPQ
jgi:hypothetical protein